MIGYQYGYQDWYPNGYPYWYQYGYQYGYPNGYQYGYPILSHCICHIQNTFLCISDQNIQTISNHLICVLSTMISIWISIFIHTSPWDPILSNCIHEDFRMNIQMYIHTYLYIISKVYPVIVSMSYPHIYLFGYLILFVISKISNIIPCYPCRSPIRYPYGYPHRLLGAGFR